MENLSIVNYESNEIGRFICQGSICDYWRVVIGSYLSCWLIFGLFFIITSHLSYRSRLIFALHIPGFFHALITSGQIGYFLLSDESIILQKDIYGYSDICQQTFAISLGFFIYDLTLGIIKRDIVFITHGFLCSLCYIFAMYPFQHYMGILFLCFEFSTICYDARIILIRINATNNTIFSIIQIGFVTTFLGVRICIGIPISIFWWINMINLILSGKYHSLIICIYLLFANLIINILNVYWAISIISKIIKHVSKKNK